MLSRRLATPLLTLSLVFSTLSLAGLRARADDTSHDVSQFFSSTGNLVFLGAAAAAPLFEDGSRGLVHSLRVADSYAMSALLAEGLKVATREKRPDSNHHDSFPSGHAAGAFAVATTEAGLHPKQAPLWYAGASLISISRVTLHQHFIHDVVAGAALGWAMGRLELSSKRGVFIAPFIRPDRTAGVHVSATF